MNYKEIIESRYNRENWQKLLHDIFGSKVEFPGYTPEVPVDKDMAKNALYIGKITLPDGHIIAIYEVELSDSVIIERNRAGIRNLLCTNWRSMGCAGAFMFCYRQNEAVLRFSYVSESFTFAEDGTLAKESTDTKRFTYLLGEGHRSRTAIQQFEKLKASSQDLKAITKAFSVEALSDMFFNEYKKNYEDIIEFITGKRMVKGKTNKWEERITGSPCKEIMQEFSVFPDAEKSVRDYVKKLMGRLVFIQFLQKKGWMGCPAGEAWNDGDKEFVQTLFANSQYKDTFVDDVLEPLFNDINTKRDGDLVSDVRVGSGIKVPYLNGGLFEHDDYDKTKFPLPAKYMKQMLDFFASYNFTIDENDPDDAEIGVDPEMLGRIFENLLEDNKDKGAFYTPKEIVQYMCRESLIAYLQTDIEEESTKDTIRQFVTTYNADLLSGELSASIDQRLKDVKICDPAIGSGAFPMGLLRELYACRRAIEGLSDEKAVEIKTHIIQQNIYGVDIEKGAVDIARLRFWLALIVDEKTPHALPNMDFKIMQGNSLLEQYEGVDLSGMSLNEQIKKTSKEKNEKAWQQSLAFDEQASLDNIQHAISEYYSTDNHARKDELRNIINTNIKSYILNLKGCTTGIQEKIQNLPIPNNKFFLWHIYFKEVFDQGGFDIVIGNPPYVGEKGHKYLFEPLKNSALGQFYLGKMDYFYFFFHHALNILSQRGICSLITTNYYPTALGALKLRLDLFERSTLIQFINFNELKIFESALGQHNLITILRKGKFDLQCKIINTKRRGFFRGFIQTTLEGTDELSKTYFAYNNELYDGEEKYIRIEVTLNENDAKSAILSKIAGNNCLLGTICEVNAGIMGGCDSLTNHNMKYCDYDYILKNDMKKDDGVFVLDKAYARDTMKYELLCKEAFFVDFFKNSDIDRYTTSKVTSKKIIFSSPDSPQQSHKLIKETLLLYKPILEKIREINNESKTMWYQLRRGTAHKNIFTKEKIVCPQRNKRNTFGYNNIEWFASADFYYITEPASDYKIFYILGLLNSKLYYFWLYNRGKRKGETLELYQKPLSEIPIKKANDEEQNAISKLVERIILEKDYNSQADTSALESEIDQLVYKLYDLTPEEIVIVENSTK